MAEYTYQPNQNQGKASNENRSKFSYFSLKDNGSEAVVRFMYSSPEEFRLNTVHKVYVDGKQKVFNCNRTPYEDISKCPLCEQGSKVFKVFYIKLLQYVKDEAGHIVAKPKIWERSAAYADRLSSLFNEYGDISDCVFKIRRTGAAGDMHTSYDIMFANPSVYKPELYVKDVHAFDDFNPIGTIISEEIPSPAAVKEQPAQPQQATPQTAEPVQQTVAPQQTAAPAQQPVQQQTAEATTDQPKPRRTYTYY